MSCWGAAGRWNRWNARTVTSWMRTSCRPVWTVARRTWCSAPLAGTRWTMPRTIPTKSCSTTAPCRILWPACSRPAGKAIWCTSVPGWSFRASTAAPGGKKTPRRPSMSTARPVWPGSRPSCRPCPSGPAWCARAGCRPRQAQFRGRHPQCLPPARQHHHRGRPHGLAHLFAGSGPVEHHAGRTSGHRPVACRQQRSGHVVRAGLRSRGPGRQRMPRGAHPLSQWPQKAPRPPYTVLDCGKLSEYLGMHPRPWTQALREHFSATRSMPKGIRHGERSFTDPFPGTETRRRAPGERRSCGPSMAAGHRS